MEVILESAIAVVEVPDIAEWTFGLSMYHISPPKTVELMEEESCVEHANQRSLFALVFQSKPSLEVLLPLGACCA